MSIFTYIQWCRQLILPLLNFIILLNIKNKKAPNQNLFQGLPFIFRFKLSQSGDFQFLKTESQDWHRVTQQPRRLQHMQNQLRPAAFFP